MEYGRGEEQMVKKLLASIEFYVTVLIRASNTERYLMKSFLFGLIRYHTVQVISFIHKQPIAYR